MNIIFNELCQLELFCNAQQYNQTGVSRPIRSWQKHSDWLRLRLTDQSQEILLGHTVFRTRKYGYHGYRRIALSISNKNINTTELAGTTKYQLCTKVKIVVFWMWAGTDHSFLAVSLRMS